jgi:hypothetical protein
MRRAVLVLLAILVASSCRAAESTAPTPEVLAARDAAERALVSELAVEDPVRRAWAAYEIGARGFASARGALVDLARSAPPEGDLMAKRVHAVVLDALARLPGTTPPAVVAAAITAKHPIEAIILAAREPAAHRQALEGLLGDTSEDAEWLTVRELLLPLRPPALAEDLLGGLTLRLQVDVSETGIAQGGGRFGARLGCGSRRYEDDFPPCAVYRLALWPADGDAVLLDGWRRVYWSRHELPGVPSTRDYPLRRDEARLELLARLAERERPGFEERTRLGVAWSGPEALLAAIASERARLAQARDALIAPLITAGLLPADAATRFPPRIVVAVADLRSVKEPALPVIP